MFVSQEDHDKILKKIASESSAPEALTYIAFLTENFTDPETFRSDHRLCSLKLLLNNSERFFNYLQVMIHRSTTQKSVLQDDVENLFESLRLRYARSHKNGDNVPALLLGPKKTIVTLATVGVAKFVNSLSSEVACKLLADLPQIVIFDPNFDIKVIIEPCFHKLQLLGPGAGVVLALGFIAYESIKAIYQYISGEITGKECVARIIVSFVAGGAGYLGGMGAAALADFANISPYLPIIAGALGAVTAGIGAAKLSQYAIEWGFDMTPDKAADEAYIFLGVTRNTPASEINDKFYALCRVYHPDMPGGSNNLWTKLQLHMTKIKAARRE